MEAPVSSQKTVELSAFSNEWFKPGASFLKRAIWYVINVLFFLNPMISLCSLKIWLLRIFGAKIGRGVVIKPNINIKYPWRLSIGDYSWIGEKVWIDNLAAVYIGKNVCISQGAMLLTGSHNYKSKSFDLIVREIKIEEGVWIGAKSVVCPGIICYSHSILTVGSVATTNMDAYCIYQGNPAEKKRTRTII